MYQTRSKNEYYVYLDRPYTLAFKQIEFGANSVLKTFNSQYQLENQRWLILSTGLAFQSPTDILIPNQYLIECRFSIENPANTIIFSNWDTSKQLAYYIWYEHLTTSLKLTYRQGVINQTVTLTTSAQLDTDITVSLYASLTQSAVYLAGTNLNLTNFVLPQLFNLDFGFNRPIAGINNANSNLSLDYFYLRPVNSQPSNYTPVALELGKDNYQFNTERQKNRLAVSELNVPMARRGLIFASPALNINTITVTSQPLTLDIDAAVPINPNTILVTNSLTLSNGTATVSNPVSIGLTLENLQIDAVSIIQSPVFADVGIDATPLTLQGTSTIGVSMSATVSTQSITLDSDAIIKDPFLLSGSISTSPLTLTGTLTRGFTLTATLTTGTPFTDGDVSAQTNSILAGVLSSAAAETDIEVSVLSPVVTTYIITQSSSYTSNLIGTYANLTDANQATGAGTNSGNQWIKATYSQPMAVTAVTVAGGNMPDWGPVAAYLNGRLIEYSIDDVNWTTVATISGVTDTGPDAQKTFTFATVVARYWRIFSFGFLATTEFNITAEVPVSIFSSLSTQPPALEADALVETAPTTAVTASLQTQSLIIESTEAIYDPEAAALFAEWTGTYSLSEKQLISDFLADLQTENIYHKLDRLYITVGKSSRDMRTCWKTRTVALEHGDIMPHYGDSIIANRVAGNNTGYLNTLMAVDATSDNYSQTSGSLFIGFIQRFENDRYYTKGSHSRFISAFVQHFNNNFPLSHLLDLNNSMNGAINIENASVAATMFEANTRTHVLTSRDTSGTVRLVFNSSEVASGSFTASSITVSDTFHIGALVSSWRGVESKAAFRFDYAGVGGNLTTAEFITLQGLVSSLKTDLNNLKTQQEVTFTYSDVNSTEEIIYFIGSDQNRRAFKNPAVFGDVKTSFASYFGATDPRDVPCIVGRRDLIGMPVDFIYSSGNTIVNNNYFDLDLGPDYTTQLSTYALLTRSDSNFSLPRNWDMQGSNDLTNWTTIDVRVNDSTLNAANQWGVFNVSVSNAGYFRYLRIATTGADSGGPFGAFRYLGFLELRLYGTLRYKTKAFSTVSISQTFTYSSGGDTNGVFYWLGTDRGRTSSFGNPQTKGFLSIQQSSLPAQSVANVNEGPVLLTNRATAQQYTYWSRDIAGQFYIIDLGPVRLRMSSYAFRPHHADDRLPRNWQLQGSTDCSSWSTLDTQTNNTSVTANTWINIPVTTSTSYRFFRLISTGFNSSGNHQFGINQLEFYGDVSGTVVE